MQSKAILRLARWAPALGAVAWPLAAAGSGVELEVVDTPFQGTTCVSINHACVAPSAITLSLDGTPLHQYDAAAVGDLQWAPQAPCLDTTQLSNGVQTLAVESTCDGVTTVDSQLIKVENPDFGFQRVAASQYEYNFGDAIALELVLGEAGLAVGADFSAFDPGYIRGHESVVDHGDGTYTVSYALTTAVAPPPIGTFAVRFTASDGRVVVAHDSPDLIRYAPSPTPRVAFAGDLAGETIFAPAPPSSTGHIAVLSSALSARVDRVGDPDVFRDVIVGYLGGKLIGSNLPGDPMGMYHYDSRGFEGVDMTEFVDGARCRGSWNTVPNILYLVREVMDFRSYDINDAPTSCP